MDPQKAYETFLVRIGDDWERRQLPLAFFIGYAYGANATRENIDAIVAATLECSTKQTEK